MLTVTEALTRTAGESLPHLEGRIVHVGKYKGGVNTVGEAYSTQIVDLCDPAYPKTKLTIRLEDFTEVPAEVKGSIGVLKAFEQTTGGFAGVILMENPVYTLSDPNEALEAVKKRKGLKKGLMVVARKSEGAFFGLDQPVSNQPHAQNTPAIAPESPETHLKADTFPAYYRESEIADKNKAEEARARKVASIRETFQTMGKFMNVHRMALACADKIGEERKAAGLTFTEAHHEKIASSLAMCVTMRNHAPANFPTESWEGYRDELKRKPASDTEAKQ